MFASYSFVTVVFACLFGGALVGMLLGRTLPEHHLGKPTEDGVKLSAGVIATMCALVIGLLLASAKEEFDTKDAELKQFSANLILLDRQLVHYGPEAREVRDLLRRYAVYNIAFTWPDEAPHRAEEANGWLLLEEVQDRLRALVPRTDGERWLQTRALQLSADLAGMRWLLDEQKAPMHTPLLTMLVVWLTIVFVSFGLFAPRNAIIVTALGVCSLSIAGAILLIVEMDHPFGGLMQVSSAPMRDALAHLTQ